jgi:hypothetical protein
MLFLRIQQVYRQAINDNSDPPLSGPLNVSAQLASDDIEKTWWVRTAPTVRLCPTALNSILPVRYTLNLEEVPRVASFLRHPNMDDVSHEFSLHHLIDLTD